MPRFHRQSHLWIQACDLMPVLIVTSCRMFHYPMVTRSKDNGWALEAVFTPGHMPNHMGFCLREEKALFAGDHVMAWATTVVAPPEGHMGDYMASLRKLLKRDDSIYYPAHGPEKRKPLTLVRGILAHRKMREEAVYNRVKAGDSSIGEIVASIYAEVDPRLHAAAGLSALAHLEHLMERKKIPGWQPFIAIA